jgi:hypothetical protein
VSDAKPATVVTDGRGDFDFIFGRWRVHNRKLVDVADPACTDWVEFEAISQAEPILDGLGHVDRIWADAPPEGQPFEGFTLRQFDPDSLVWRIWWASSSRPGHLDPPVEGSWTSGRGRFICDDVLGGLAVKVRFEWSNESPSTARWEQAFSYDGGSTWRTNWVMELARMG